MGLLRIMVALPDSAYLEEGDAKQAAG